LRVVPFVGMSFPSQANDVRQVTLTALACARRDADVDRGGCGRAAATEPEKSESPETLRHPGLRPHRQAGTSASS
jgi:hypothetical protein